MDLFLRREKERSTREEMQEEKKMEQWNKIFIVSSLGV